MIKKVTIEVVAHENQRYPTAGDWVMDGEDLMIFVSETGNDNYNYLLMVHELVEALLCERDDIEQSLVDKFDRNYEKKRKKGDLSEPGDNPNAPYYEQHQVATLAEKIVALQMLIDWPSYEDKINKL